MATGTTEVSVTGDSIEPGQTKSGPISIAGRVGRVALNYLLVLSLFGYYSFGAAMAELGSRSAGYRNAGIVWTIQRFLHLPDEAWLQQMTLADNGLYAVLNRYYAFVHFPASLFFVIWVSVARRDQWKRIAAALSVTTFLYLTIDAVFPVAPPRLYAPAGMVDTLAKFGPDVYGAEAVRSVADQYGAMPSIHFGWSVFVAWGIIQLAPKLGVFRWLAVVHPLMTLAAVTLTGNHYWLDCLVAGLLVPVGIWLTDQWMRRTTPSMRARMRRPLLIAAIPLCLFGLYNISGIFI